MILANSSLLEISFSTLYTQKKTRSRFLPKQKYLLECLITLTRIQQNTTVVLITKKKKNKKPSVHKPFYQQRNIYLYQYMS